MKREVTYAEREDGYWYRMVLVDNLSAIFYTWGTADMRHNYRADLEYLGRESYRLSKRTYNGAHYKDDEIIKRKHRRRVKAYNITMAMIERILRA